MKKKLQLLLLLLIMILPFSPCIAEDDPRGYASWWIKNSGQVTSTEDLLVVRSEKVFARVYAAADKKGNRYPKLVVIKGKKDPWVIAIRDGSVIITDEAIKLCYSGVTTEKGDSRMAFLFGHELSHLSKDDFWHLAAFTAVRKHADDKGVRNALIDQLAQTGDSRPGDPSAYRFVRMKELQADSYGLINMAVAGYDPRAVIDNDGTNFFEEWVSQITGKVAYEDETHPGSKERAEFLRVQLASVAEDLDYFAFGVRFYEIGRYNEAIRFFEAFQEKFPGREVFSNLGLSYFQLGMKTLALCDRSMIMRFRLSTALDTETLGRKFRLRGPKEADCLKAENTARNFALAEEYLKKAESMDNAYIQAKINLSSVYIITDKYSKAMALIDEALSVHPDNLDILNNKAIALYLFGKKGHINAADNALGVLGDISARKPYMGSSWYNAAAIKSEMGLNDAAQRDWQSFLQIENTGIYADYVRDRLKLNQSGIASPVRSAPKSPFKLGEMNSQTEKLLSTAKKKEFQFGEFSGAIYEIDNSKILTINDSIEIIERYIKQYADEPQDIDAFISKYGKPMYKIEGGLGEIYLYSEFAFEAKEGKVKKVIHFMRERG